MATGRWLSLLFSAIFSALLTPCCGQQFQQIVLGNTVTCNMSTIYSEDDGTSLDCSGAINGNNDTHWYPNDTSDANCVFTGRNHWPAYWFLNLGQQRTIHRITIYYIQYGTYNYIYAMRNVRVSVDGSEIFTYPGVTSSITNPTQISDNLPTTGQIVKVERTTQADRNYLPLCEVQLWECKRDRYGKECANTCSTNCQDNGRGKPCDATTGACNQDCVSGWYGSDCTRLCAPKCEGACVRDNGTCHSCVRGYYGMTCQLQCGKGCVNNCSRQDGECTCMIGWSSPYCTECDSGYYGVESCEECGYCRDDDVCNNTNGHCPRGCRDYFDGDRCDKCETGYFGVESCKECGYCRDDDVCNNTNGHCPRGCRDGFDGDRCDRCAAGYYGVTCQFLCGKGCAESKCSRQDGACACLTGWSPPFCVVTASESSASQDGGNIAGPVVGGLLGAGALIGLSILLAAIIRRRRSRDTPDSRDPDGRREAQSSHEDAQVRVDTEGLKTETSDADTHYESLEKYENPDDIKPYSTLETDHGRRANVNIQGDKEAVLYHNITSYKTQ